MKTENFLPGGRGAVESGQRELAEVMRRSISRREFVATATVLAGALSLRVAGAKEAESSGTDPLRVVFATDAHLMLNDALRSDAGIISCLQAIGAMRPKPDFILCGGDLTHESPPRTNRKQINKSSFAERDHPECEDGTDR